MVEEKEATVFRARFSLLVEIRSLVATGLRNLNSLLMMEDMEEIIADAIDIGFNAASNCVRQACFCFVEKAINDMEHHRLMDEVIHESFERWTQSEVLTNNLAEEEFKHQSLTERVLELTRSMATKSNFVKSKTKNVVPKEKWTHHPPSPKMNESLDANLFVIAWGRPRKKEFTGKR